MSYILEGKKEFDRLEKQSQTPAYDYRKELAGLLARLKKNKIERILDAGCGSGVVTRYLSEQFPKAQVTGCDFSEIRVAQAREAAHGFSSARFEQQDLTRVTYPNDHFDVIVTRFVIEHLNPAQRQAALSELHRCLKPGGILYVIDVDGLITNIYPCSDFLAECMREFVATQRVDLHVGRKLPALLHKTGFESVTWDIDLMNFSGEDLRAESRITAERFDASMPLLAPLLGADRAAKFKSEYLAALELKGAVLFYNKFLVTAQKAVGAKKIRVVK